MEGHRKLEKQEAQQRILRLWAALPPRRRLTVGQAIEFAENLDPALLKFRTLGNPKQIAVAWLVKEVERSAGPAGP